MRLGKIFMVAVLPLLFTGTANAQENHKVWRVYVGTYTGGESGGVYLFPLDAETGEPGEVVLAGAAENPSFLALHPDRPVLYACGEVSGGGTVSAFRMKEEDGALSLLNAVSSEGRGPCHVAVSPSGQHVAVANYSGGSMALLPIDETGALKPACEAIAYTGQGPNTARQEAPHAHAANFGPEGRVLYITDLGTDRVHVYDYDGNAGTLTAASPPAVVLPAGAGPRHLAIHPNRRFAYVVNELGNSVTAFRRNEAGTLEPMQTVGTLPEGFTGPNTTAEIAVHPSGKFLYASNRGHDSVAVFATDADTGKLLARGHTSTGGKTPRNFNITPDGRYLLAANQDSDNIVIFRIDADSGALQPTGKEVSVPRPVCIVVTEP